MEPAVCNFLRRKIRSFIITHHHIGSFTKYLTVFSDLYLHTFYQWSYRTKPPSLYLVTVNRNDRRCFGKPITFHNNNSCSGKDADQPDLAGSSTCNNTTDIIAKSFSPFVENKFIGQGQLHVVPWSLVLVDLKLLS